MKRLRHLLSFLALLLVVAFALTGCGKTAQHQTGTLKRTAPAAPRAPFVCHHKEPAQMGECVRQELEYNGVTPARPPLAALLGARFHAQGIDISRWQPHPSFHLLYREGIRFVIVQTNDGSCACNPFFRSQVQSAHEAGLKVGVYVFVEASDSAYQAGLVKIVSASERRRISLGAWIDTEVPGAYGHACAIAASLRRSFYIVGTYTSPGNWPGGSCGGNVWPAEWGGGAAYPPSGFSHASILLRQWCGTCALAGGGGGQIDRDEDLGAIARSTPVPRPKPLTHKQARAKLAEVNRLLGAYDRRHNPHGHNCAHPPYPHAYPSAAYNGACLQWAREAAALRRKVG